MSEAQAPSLLPVSASLPQGPLQGPSQGSPQAVISGLGLARFSQLLIELEQADGTHARQQVLQVYFGEAVPSDAAWAAWLLSGERLKRLVPLAVLKQAAMVATDLPDWAFEECYQTVGDLAETIALLVGQVDAAKASGGSAMASLGLSDWIRHRLLPLRNADQAAAQAVIQESWAQLAPREVFCLNKLITGGLRVGVSRQMVAAALSALSGVSRETMATRLIAFTADLPSADAFTRLLAPAEATEALLGPVPFFLAQSLTLAEEVLADPESAATALGQRLGPVEDWSAEWKWDGIRAQVIVRGATVAIWSRGEELVTEMFPELAAAMRLMSQAVDADLLLDGEILVWDAQSHRPQPFAALQTRLGRKRPSARLLQSTPAVFMAYDLLRWSAEDLRPLAFSQRRTRLEAAVREAGLHYPAVMQQLRLSPLLALSSWQEAWRLRRQAQAHFVEGVMLKRQQAGYGQGRQKKTPQGECWKWKRSPFSVDAVLVYAQRGHGRRAGLYTDYGFALWDDRVSPAVLVPFAKAYSGLTDAEIRQVDQVIRKSILEKFGPVRQVAPSLVMELGFEGVMASGRHKSGYAVRFPRILRLRPDKTVAQADCLSALAAFLQVPPEPSE
ncbi:MAG: ATP-dependent DNA ligase [Betaproteobacteria bacterium]|nr:ATP-dependent DNA ligase [Betaproteobacteria bacterium]